MPKRVSPAGRTTEAPDTHVVAHAGHHEAIRHAIAAGGRSFEQAHVVAVLTASRLVAAGVALMNATGFPPGDRTDGTTEVVR